MKESTQSLAIPPATMIWFFASIIMLAAVYMILDVLGALFFAVIVASAMEPGITWLKARKIPRIFGVLLIFLIAASAFALIAYLIFPILVHEMRTFIAAYPRLETEILGELEHIGIQVVLPDYAGVRALLRAPAAYLGAIAGGTFNALAVLFGGFFSLLMVIVFSFYLAAQERGIEGFLKIVTPVAHEPYIIDLWRRSQKKLGRWLQAQLLLGAMVGVFIFFGLSLLQVPNALLLAALAALFEIIPVVGPILASVPAVAIAFLISPVLGLATVTLYVLVQQTESHVIVPVVMRKVVGLSPLVVVFALIVGAKLGGIFGLLLAVPLTTVMVEFLEDWDKKKRAFLTD